MRKIYVGGFLYNPQTREVLLHKRDGKTDINPNKWAFFGGSAEEGETPLQAFIREMGEELTINLRVDEIKFLCDYPNKERETHRYLYFVVSNKSKSQMTLTEGADFDWISLERVFDYDLTEKTRNDLKTFLTIENSIEKL